MKFNVLALDYDGTIAVEGKLHSAVRKSLQEAHDRGIVVVLVTGRILSDLRKTASNLDLFDAVVAENGAVIAFPNGQNRVLDGPPPRTLLDELGRAGVECKVGECVVEADARAAPRILAAVTQMELPLVLAFNRARVMVLPQGISKATGLREALNTLRLSLRNCLAIGDAENDYSLLAASEIAVTVEWGSPSLRGIADEVIHGNGPSAVAQYIKRATQNSRLPPNNTNRRRLLLGRTDDGQALQTAVHGQIILIGGDPRSGKSWITGLFCEQLILQNYCLCIVDPEGDYGSLESLPGVVVLGGNGSPPSVAEVTRALRYPDVSVVISLSTLTHTDKANYVKILLPILAQLKRTTGQPHWIVVDEAHYFLHASDCLDVVDTEFAGYVLVTHRVSNLHPDLLKVVELVFVTQITDPNEAEALVVMYGAGGAEAEWKSILSCLEIDEAAQLAQIHTTDHRLQRFRVAERLTPHVRHRAKYVEIPVHDHNTFVFTSDGQPIGESARTVREFVMRLRRVPKTVIDGHARRGDFSRWIADVFGDRPLATEIRKLEVQHQHTEVPNLSTALIAAIQERYEVGEIVGAKTPPSG